MTKILYIGAVGSNNLGDEAILLANRRLFPNSSFTLARIEEHTIPEHDITLLGGGTILPKALTRQSYNVTKSKYNYCLGVGVADPDLYQSCYGNLDLTWGLARHDVYIGDLWDKLGVVGSAARRGLKMLGDPFQLTRRYYTDQDYAKAQSYGFDKITVRGPISKKILLQYGIKANIIGDPALYLEPKSYHDNTTGKITICIHDRGKRWPGASRNYRSELQTFCQGINSDYDFMIVPFHPQDMNLAKEFAAGLPDADILDYASENDIEGVLKELSSSDLVIGEKLHANVLSAACHTPFISFEYNPKNRDFAHSVGLPELNIRIDRITNDKILHLYKYINASRDTLISQLQTRVAAYRDSLEVTSNHWASEW